MRELSNTDVQNCAAASAWPSNHRQGAIRVSRAMSVSSFCAWLAPVQWNDAGSAGAGFELAEAVDAFARLEVVELEEGSNFDVRRLARALRVRELPCPLDRLVA